MRRVTFPGVILRIPDAWDVWRFTGAWFTIRAGKVFRLRKARV